MAENCAHEAPEAPEVTGVPVIKLPRMRCNVAAIVSYHIPVDVWKSLGNRKKRPSIGEVTVVSCVVAGDIHFSFANTKAAPNQGKTTTVRGKAHPASTLSSISNSCCRRPLRFNFSGSWLRKLSSGPNAFLKLARFAAQHTHQPTPPSSLPSLHLSHGPWLLPFWRVSCTRRISLRLRSVLGAFSSRRAGWLVRV